MARRLNADSEHEIKESEALKLVAYLDSGGVWTIGWGHTGKVDGKLVGKGMRITQPKAQMLFDSDTSWACDTVERVVQVELNDWQFGALVSLCINIGAKAFTSSTLVKKLNGGDYDSVPRELMKWVNDNGKRVPGLVNRRARDAALWAKGAHGQSHAFGVISTNAQKAPPNIAPRDVATAIGLGSAGMAGGATGDGTTTVSRIVDTVTMQQYDLTSGDFLRVGIALVIVGLTIFAIYRYRQNQ